MNQYTVLILELRNIIYKPPSKLDTPVPLHTLDIISHSSNSWFQYEKGDLSEYDCYTRVAAEYNLDKAELELTVKEARAALTVDRKLFVLLQRIKAAFNLQIIIMTNISSFDYAHLRARPANWGIFDHVFTSHAVGERKPNLNFYRHVLKALDVDPTKVISVDDQFDNVFAARSLGMQGVLFETSDALEHILLNLLGNAVERGQDFLRCNAGVLDCISEETEQYPSQVIDENWTQLLILEATGDRSLVDFIEHEGKWNFFKADAQLTTKYYPDDLDTTAVGLTVLKPSQEIAMPILDEMLKYVTSDGILLTYFNTERPRVDAGICVNILTLFYTYGGGDKVQPTLLWVRDILKYRAYLDGTKYFKTPEIFLWLLTRLLSCSTDPELHLTLDLLLKERVQERIGAAGDALALAMRILVCNFVGIRDEVDLRTLFTMQCIDGGWEIGWMYHFPTSGVSIGNRGLTTALAIKAIEVSSNPLPK